MAITDLLRVGKPLRAVAGELCLSPATISREAGR
ncbi:helix-turn-helix domain-containing protein [Catenulispora rubra]